MADNDPSAFQGEGCHDGGDCNVGPASAGAEHAKCREQHCEIAEHIENQRLTGISMKELSMGMSHDFPVAIAEGATLVRVGTAIFGSRQYA